MSIVVPPAPTHKEAADVLAKLAQLSSKEPVSATEGAVGKQPHILLAASCVLSAIGVLLLICTIIIICAPESLFARLLLLIFQTLL